MKRKPLSLLLLLLPLLSLQAQKSNCECEKDFLFLHEKIERTPAYKINRTAYQSTRAELQNAASSAQSQYECYLILNKLLLPLNDNHSRIYGIDPGATSELRSRPEGLAPFKKTALYSAYPKTALDLDSLKIALSDKPATNLEGIYTRGDSLRIGLVKTHKVVEYQAIVLSEGFELWSPGEVIYSYIPYGNDYLLGVGGGISSKRMIAYTERIDQGTFAFMGFSKHSEQFNYGAKLPTDNLYFRQELGPEITYLSVGSFNSWYPTLSDAEAFYASLENSLTKEHLILDLRNNGGGGERNSNLLLKILKKYAKEHNLYVLTNHRTASNAEQFTHELRSWKRATIFGQRTNGTLAYEIKDSSYELPCGQFVAILSSKKHAEYLPFESQGLEPDHLLDPTSDWIEQVVEYIRNH
ncbi:S41 family peptidase [Croceiramulus getboli]|nr:S41 family peptidase [Flavobacteriaceae bacterium YJPT1-3]